MSDVLARICADKRRHIAARKQAVPEAALAEQAKAAPAPRGLARALASRADEGRPRSSPSSRRHRPARD